MAAHVLHRIDTSIAWITGRLARRECSSLARLAVGLAIECGRPPSWAGSSYVGGLAWSEDRRHHEVELPVAGHVAPPQPVNAADRRRSGLSFQGSSSPLPCTASKSFPLVGAFIANS